MFLTIKQFADAWQQESDGTRKIFAALTDDSLSKKVADEHRTLGRMAWHIVLTLGEMAGNVGLKINAPAADSAMPSSVTEIRNAYKKAATDLLEKIQNEWKDTTLTKEDEMFGQKFTRGFSLWMTLVHEIHHRAQMTVLMRQAGLKVPGLYGPSYDEWDSHGAKPPAI